MTLPHGITEIRDPDMAELLAVANEAAAANLHLITDGRRIVYSPWVPPGWHRMAVKVRDAA